jgi:lysophospholipase L1-like esterase
MGRTQTHADGSLTFAYPGVAFTAQVHAQALSFTASSSQGNSWLDIQVDDGPSRAVRVMQNEQAIEVFHHQRSGAHRVVITHRTEPWIGAVTLKHWTLKNGTFQAAPVLPPRKIMVLGDSITCGEATERVAGEAKHSGWWNGRNSYGFLTAHALNAQVHLICAGGRGLTRSWNGKNDEAKLADFYRYTLGDANHSLFWNSPQYSPDVIIVAIGTNDFSPGIPTPAHFINRYINFLHTLRADYPAAQILITEGPMLQGQAKTTLVDFLQQICKQLNDEKIMYYASIHAGGDAQDAHPTLAQHQQMAAALTAYIRTLMHW